MVARLGRRAFEWIIGVFALLGFVYVPLGKKTGFEHAQAIFTTREAAQAGRDLLDRASELRRRLFAGATQAQTAETKPPRHSAPRSGPKAPTPKLPDLALVEVEVPDAGIDASVEWSPEL